MASKRCVEFFYDVVSPYSWVIFEEDGQTYCSTSTVRSNLCKFVSMDLALEGICRYQTRWNIDLRLRPFFLGGVMHLLDRKPPPPSRVIYTRVDLKRLATYFELPFRFRENPTELMFGSGTLKAQRFLTSLGLTQPEKVEDMSREIFYRAWSRDEDVYEDKSLTEAAKKIGLTDNVIQYLLICVKDDAIKERLKATTQEAIDLGAFGSPIFTLDIDNKKEMVFGGDRFPIMAQLLGEKWEGPNPGVSSKL